jgi:hypothetical protein
MDSRKQKEEGYRGDKSKKGDREKGSRADNNDRGKRAMDM